MCAWQYCQKWEQQSPDLLGVEMLTRRHISTHVNSFKVDRWLTRGLSAADVVEGGIHKLVNWLRFLQRRPTNQPANK